jgi:hypothetical protein
MRRIVPALLPAAFILLFSIFASACGDKLLVLGRGLDFDNLTARHKASILAYVPATLPPSAAVSDTQFHAALKKAGHKLRLIQDAGILAEDVRSGRYDLILVDFQDAPTVEKQVTAAAVNAVVMPVVYDGAELKTADLGHFSCVRKSSGKNRACFSTIDKAIEAKLKRDEVQHRTSK